MRYSGDGGDSLVGALLIALFVLRAVYLAVTGNYAALANDLVFVAAVLVMVLVASVTLRHGPA